jgi:hypothetical protein
LQVDCAEAGEAKPPEHKKKMANVPAISHAVPTGGQAICFKSFISKIVLN